MDVLLVAAKKEKIADYTGVISQAGRVPVVVDVDAFALQNAYEINYGLEPGAVVVLLNAGASAININILSGDQSLFTRDISIGGNAYTEAVQKELNLPFDSAEQAKKGEPVDGVAFDDVRPVLHAMTENVLLEIQKTFDFFKATAASDRIDRILLSGGASRVDGFAQALEERFGAPVEMFDPFRKIAFDAAKLGVDDAGAAGADRGRGRRPRAQKGGRPMIRINLLAVERKRGQEEGRRSRSVGPEAHGRLQPDPARRRLRASAGGTGRSARSRHSSTPTSRPRSRKPRGCTRSSQQVQQFEQRKAQLQQRVALIEQLRKDQTGPVHMLDQISRALPPMLWLTELKQGAAPTRS